MFLRSLIQKISLVNVVTYLWNFSKTNCNGCVESHIKQAKHVQWFVEGCVGGERWWTN